MIDYYSITASSTGESTAGIVHVNSQRSEPLSHQFAGSHSSQTSSFSGSMIKFPQTIHEPHLPQLLSQYPGVPFKAPSSHNSALKAELHHDNNHALVEIHFFQSSQPVQLGLSITPSPHLAT
jgi:hypothetical protein